MIVAGQWRFLKCLFLLPRHKVISLLHVNFYWELIFFHDRTAHVGAPVLHLLHLMRKRICSAIARETSWGGETLFICTNFGNHKTARLSPERQMTFPVLLVAIISAIQYGLHPEGVWSAHLGCTSAYNFHPGPSNGGNSLELQYSRNTVLSSNCLCCML